MRITIEDDRPSGITLAHPSAAPGEISYGGFVKAEDDRRFSLGLAYPAMRVDPKRGADGKRDFVQPDVLEMAAHSWMLKALQDHSGAAGMFHFNGAGGGAPIENCCSIAESYIYRGPDWLLKSVDDVDVTIYAGDWLMAAYWTAEAWPMVKSLQVRGWSPEGFALRSPPSLAALAGLRST